MVGRLEMDGWFFEALSDFSDYSDDILTQLVEVTDYLPIEDRWAQQMVGVVKGKSPLFFRIEFLNTAGELPLLLDFESIDSDTYLDYVNLNKSIQFYLNKKKYDNTNTDTDS